MMCVSRLASRVEKRGARRRRVAGAMSLKYGTVWPGLGFRLGLGLGLGVWVWGVGSGVWG